MGRSRKKLSLLFIYSKIIVNNNRLLQKHTKNDQNKIQKNHNFQKNMYSSLLKQFCLAGKNRQNQEWLT